MKVLLTGGTGFVGNAVIDELCRLRHAIRVLVRRPFSKNAKALEDKPGVELFQGDILDPANLDQAVAGMDAIIHLVGIIREQGKNRFSAVHAEGTLNLLNAAKKMSIPKWIQMSALGTRPDAVSRYHQTKWEAEEFVRESGIPHVIFRPSIIYGPDDEFVNLFARISRFSPLMPVMGNGNGKLQPVSVDTVARCFALALDREGALANTIDLCGPEPMTFNELLATTLRVLGRRRLTIHLPMPLAEIIAFILEKGGALTGAAPPINRDQLIMLREDNTGHCEPAMQLFGFDQEPFEQGIRHWLTPG